MIPLTEYAARHGITYATARQRAMRGAYKTAQKVRKTWLISEDEPHVDHREHAPKEPVTGWRKACGYDVWVEDGRVLRGIDNGRTVYPYKTSKSGGWDKGTPTIETLRAGLHRGSWRMM